jgi:hypothetical protein
MITAATMHHAVFFSVIIRGCSRLASRRPSSARTAPYFSGNSLSASRAVTMSVASSLCFVWIFQLSSRKLWLLQRARAHFSIASSLVILRVPPATTLSYPLRAARDGLRGVRGSTEGRLGVLGTSDSEQFRPAAWRLGCPGDRLTVCARSYIFCLRSSGGQYSTPKR